VTTTFLLPSLAFSEIKDRLPLSLVQSDESFNLIAGWFFGYALTGEIRMNASAEAAFLAQPSQFAALRHPVRGAVIGLVSMTSTSTVAARLSTSTGIG